MASLLAHSEQIPFAARDAIRRAQEGPAACREHRLESAARILERETGVGRPDARELVDLRPADCWQETARLPPVGASEGWDEGAVGNAALGADRSAEQSRRRL
ncbi:MAG TPA: hypothetical protein VEK07_04045 [Polyangiaceae bacterium]|nr:hypothetical protein [Polyangiaceae bacterium]